MKKLFLFFMITTFVVTFNSCKKYDDGPMFSVLSTKARLTNIWTIEKEFLNGNELPTNANWANGSMELKKDGSVVFTENNIQTNTGAKWTLDTKKEKFNTSVHNSPLTYLPGVALTAIGWFTRSLGCEHLFTVKNILILTVING